MRVSLTGNTACYEYYTIGCLDIETHGDKQTTDEARDGIYDRVGMWCGYFITEFHDEDFKDRKYWAHNPEEMIKLIDDKCKEVGNLLNLLTGLSVYCLAGFFLVAASGGSSLVAVQGLLTVAEHSLQDTWASVAFWFLGSRAQAP